MNGIINQCTTGTICTMQYLKNIKQEYSISTFFWMVNLHYLHYRMHSLKKGITMAIKERKFMLLFIAAGCSVFRFCSVLYT